MVMRTKHAVTEAFRWLKEDERRERRAMISLTKPQMALKLGTEE